MQMEKVSDLVKAARNNLGLSQRELARRIKVDNAAISRIENGEIKKPSYEVLKKLSDELNIELVELLTSARYTEGELERFGGFMKKDYYVINLYDIDFIVFSNDELYICYQNGERLNMDSSKGLNIKLIYKNIIKDLNNKFLVIDDSYY